MRVADRLTLREASWRELETLLDGLKRRKPASERAAQVIRLGELYRAACTDLMLAETHDLPRDTVAYLHALVGRAHNEVYRAQGFQFGDWATALFDTAPRQLLRDPALKLSALIFLGAFLICALLAAGRPEFARGLLGDSALQSVEDLYAKPPSEIA